MFGHKKAIASLLNHVVALAIEQVALRERLDEMDEACATALSWKNQEITALKQRLAEIEK